MPEHRTNDELVEKPKECDQRTWLGVLKNWRFGKSVNAIQRYPSSQGSCNGNHFKVTGKQWIRVCRLIHTYITFNVCMWQKYSEIQKTSLPSQAGGTRWDSLLNQRSVNLENNSFLQQKKLFRYCERPTEWVFLFHSVSIKTIEPETDVLFNLCKTLIHITVEYICSNSDVTKVVVLYFKYSTACMHVAEVTIAERNKTKIIIYKTQRKKSRFIHCPKVLLGQGFYAGHFPAVTQPTAAIEVFSLNAHRHIVYSREKRWGSMASYPFVPLLIATTTVSLDSPWWLWLVGATRNRPKLP